MGIVVSLEARRQGRPDRSVSHASRARTAFYFDLADPGTYLAAERVDRLFPGMDWVPASLEALRAARGAAAGMGDERAHERAASLRMPLVWPERHPDQRPAAMRAAAFAAEKGRGSAFLPPASRPAFLGGFDLDDPEVLAQAAPAAGIGLDECLQAARAAQYDAAIESATRSLVAAGVDRLPVLRVGRTLFAGEDRLGEAAAGSRV